MLAEVPAAFQPLTKEALLDRPLETGIAVDPVHAHEIDDAVSVGPTNSSGDARIKIHVADAGLLYGTRAAAQAREKGWTEYFEDGSADMMLPTSIVESLSLTANHYNTGTAPAITIAFTINSIYRVIRDTEIYPSRLACDAIDYDSFEQEIAGKTNRGARFGKWARKINAESGQRNGLLDEYGGCARNAVSQYMVAANRIIAGHMTELDLPWLFRNHHMDQFDGDNVALIRELYPYSELFAEHNLGWYARFATRHDGLNLPTYCHFTSPLRRFPDLVNHLNLYANLHHLPLAFNEADLDDIADELALMIERTHALGAFAVQAS